MKKKSESAALFLRLGLLSTLHVIRHETKVSVNDLQPEEIWKV